MIVQIVPKKHYKPHKSYFPNCQSLREAAGISISTLASKAGVNRNLIASLEKQGTHTNYKVHLVFNILNLLHQKKLNSEQEIIPQRFLPRCKTLREACKLSIATLAKQSQLSPKIIESIEKNHGAYQQQVEIVFSILNKYYTERYKESLLIEDEMSLAAQ